MRGHRFFKILLLSLIPIIWVASCFLLVFGMFSADSHFQKAYQAKYGDAWKEQYEKERGAGSLEEAQHKRIAAYAAVPGVTLPIGLLVWQIRRKKHRSRRRKRKRNPQEKGPQ